MHFIGTSGRIVTIGSRYGPGIDALPQGSGANAEQRQQMTLAQPSRLTEIDRYG
jgi:hypothetical protein